MKKPSLPAVPADSSPRERAMFYALKENVEAFRGLRGGVVTPLADTASTADIIRAVNGLITVLQGN